MPPSMACSIDGCDQTVFARGWCQRHYGRWRQHGNPLGGRAMRHSITGITCSAEGGCGLPVEARGLCSKHYARLRLTGIVDTTVREMWAGSDVIAFLADLVRVGGEGCVTWPGCRDRNGYGRATAMGEALAHRVACRLAHGDPPPGKPLALHACGKGREGCVAPWHLYWGDHDDNVRDAIRHGAKPMGETHPAAKLTTADIPVIRRDHRSDTETALDYGVSPRTIADVRAGRTWKHVPWD